MTARLPAHHFGDALLFDYASGALCEPLALVVATHVALCETCRGKVAAAEAAADSLLPTGAAAGWRLPGSLAAYLGDDPAALDWQPLADGVDAVALHPVAARAWPPRTQVLLVRLVPGAVAPRHTHEGIEATVILQGGFADQFGQYERGDAWIVDASVTHAPVALPGETCLCLAYYDAPMKPVPLTPIVSSI